MTHGLDVCTVKGIGPGTGGAIGSHTANVAAAERQCYLGTGFRTASDGDAACQFRSVDGVVPSHRVDGCCWRHSVDRNRPRAGGTYVASHIGSCGAQGLCALAHGANVSWREGIAPGAAAVGGNAAGIASNGQIKGTAGLSAATDDCRLFSIVDDVVDRHRVDGWRKRRGRVDCDGVGATGSALIAASAFDHCGKAVISGTQGSRCIAPVVAGHSC